MTRLLFVSICISLLGLAGCKKNSTQYSTISYVANGVAYTNSTSVEPPPTDGPFAPRNPTLPSPLGMIWIKDDSLSILASTATGTTGGNSVQSDLSLSFYNPDTTVGTIKPGFYSYQLGALKTHWDTVNAELAGIFTFSTESSSYTILLSDTVVITSVNTYLVNGSFEATFSTKLGGDSIVHITNGTFTNFDLSPSSINAVIPD